MVADALSRIGEKWLPQEETDEILKTTSLLKGDLTVVEVYNEKEEDRAPEKDLKWTISKDKMKAVLDKSNNGCC